MTRPVLTITAPPPPGASPAYLAAWNRRQRANTTGRCDCGATITLPNRAERRAAKAQRRVIHRIMLHEHGCPASDGALRDLYRAGMS
jgi:hypothetical protein